MESPRWKDIVARPGPRRRLRPYSLVGSDTACIGRKRRPMGTSASRKGGIATDSPSPYVPTSVQPTYAWAKTSTSRASGSTIQ